MTYYHIIDVDKRSTEQSPNLTLEQFENEGRKINIPNELDFEIIYEELE